MDPACRARLFPKSVEILFQNCGSFEYAEQDAVDYVVRSDWKDWVSPGIFEENSLMKTTATTERAADTPITGDHSLYEDC